MMTHISFLATKTNQPFFILEANTPKRVLICTLDYCHSPDCGCIHTPPGNHSWPGTSIFLGIFWGSTNWPGSILHHGSQNHRLIEKFVLEGTFKGRLVPNALPWARTASTRPGCSKPHPAWP